MCEDSIPFLHMCENLVGSFLRICEDLVPFLLV